MKKSLPAVIVFALIIFMSADVFAEWVFQFSSGGAINAPTNLKIKQDGEEDIDLTAEYDTKSSARLRIIMICVSQNGKITRHGSLRPFTISFIFLTGPMRSRVS